MTFQQKQSYAGLLLFACVGMVGLLIAVIVILSLLFRDPDAIHKAACETHLRSIATALDLYHQDYGSFPPAFIADAQGRPMHSWRVLILPFLGEDDLYKEYKLDEPWDGPSNQRLAHRIPDVYACSSDPGGFDGQTGYLAPVGTGTAWDGAKPVKLSLLPRASQSAQVIEVYESGVNWLEPRDLQLPSASGESQVPITALARSLHPGGAHILYADGKVEFVSTPAGP